MTRKKDNNNSAKYNRFLKVRTFCVIFLPIMFLLGMIFPIFDLMTNLLLIISLVIGVVCNSKLKRNDILVAFLIALIIIMNLALNDDGYLGITKDFAELLAISYLIKDIKFNSDSKLLKIFELLVVLYFVSILIYHFLKGWRGGPISFEIWDKNRLGIVTSIMFYISLRTKRYIYSLIYALFIIFADSRMLMIADAIILIFSIVSNKKAIIKISKWVSEKASVRNVFTLLFFVPTIITIVLSAFMAYSIKESTITDYKESFNDTSNAVRVRSNLYAVNKISSNPRFIMFGYDSNILSRIGGGTKEHHDVYLGYRVVQPHNVVINLIMRYGLISATVYVLIVSRMIYEKISKNNIGFLVAYTFCCMFLALIMGGIYLPLFAIAISIKEENE